MELYSNEIIELLEELDSDTPLLHTDGAPYTVQMLLLQSQRLACNLHDIGMRPGDRVIIASEPGIDFMTIMFATQYLRCTVAIIDPEMGRENYKAKLNQFVPNWVFLDSRLALLQEHPILRYIYFKYKKNGLYFPWTKSVTTITTGRWMPLLQSHFSINKLLKKSSRHKIQMSSTSSFPYLVTYTSGTITQPKGVLHTTNGLKNSIVTIANILRSDKEQTLATHLPHFMLIGACAGIGTKLWDIRWSIEKRYEFIRSEGITTIFGPPVEYQALIDYCKDNGRMFPDTLTHLVIGSAPVHHSFLRRLIRYIPEHTQITCFYGMTENLVVSTIDGRIKSIVDSQGDPLGIPVDGVDIRIASDGEIFVKSNQLYERYWHREEREVWHATGDLGYLDDSGNIILKGRKKDMIIRKNFNLYPGLYIPTINKIEGVKEAVYIGKYDECLADEVVHLFVEAEPNLTEEALWEKLKYGSLSIDKEAWPDHIHFLEIPRKGRQHKVDRDHLRGLLS